MKKRGMATLLFLCLALAGCGSGGDREPETLSAVRIDRDTEADSGMTGKADAETEFGPKEGDAEESDAAVPHEEGATSAEPPSETGQAPAQERPQEPEILNFVDVFGQEYWDIPPMPGTVSGWGWMFPSTRAQSTGKG